MWAGRWGLVHLSADADGLLDGVDEFVGAEMVDCLTVQLICETGVVAQTGDRVGDVGVSGTESGRCL